MVRRARIVAVWASAGASAGLALLGCGGGDVATVRAEPLSVEVRVVEVLVPLEITLREGPGVAASAIVSGPSEGVGAIELDVHGDTLTITTTERGRWLSPKRDPVTVTLVTPPLRQLDLYEGAAARTTAPMTAEQLLVSFRGKVAEADLEVAVGRLRYFNNGATAGRLRVRGTAEQLVVDNIALASVDARELETPTAEVFNASIGEVRVTARDTLRYDIEGRGDVILFGGGVAVGETRGAGRLRRG